MQIVQKKVKVIGLGSRIQGEKNGYKFDFVPVSIVHQDKDIEGMAADTVAVPTEDYEKWNPRIDQTYSIWCHKYKGKLCLDGVL